jgi:hypothetical protein
MDKNTKYFLIITTSMLLIYFIYRFFSFEKNTKITEGYFDRKVFWPKSGTNYIFKFNYNNYSYSASTKLSGTDIDITKFENNASRFKFNICFDSTNPSDNIVLLTKKDYQFYNLKYPLFLDSMQTEK